MNIQSLERISTRNLTLRPYVLDDAEEFRSAIIETLDLLLPWMPWAHLEPQTLEEKKERIRIFTEARAKNEDFVFGIFLKDGTFAGSTGLHPRVGPRRMETGYWMRKRYHGKGYATEAAYAMTKAAFEYGDIDQMVIRCDPENHKSVSIPGKLGFTLEGKKFSDTFKKDHYYFTLNKSDLIQMEKYEPVEYVLTNTAGV